MPADWRAHLPSTSARARPGRHRSVSSASSKSPSRRTGRQESGATRAVNRLHFRGLVRSCFRTSDLARECFSRTSQIVSMVLQLREVAEMPKCFSTTALEQVLPIRRMLNANRPTTTTTELPTRCPEVAQREAAVICAVLSHHAHEPASLCRDARATIRHAPEAPRPRDKSSALAEKARRRISVRNFAWLMLSRTTSVPAAPR